MVALWVGIAGFLIFVGGVILFGHRLRHHPSTEDREKSTRIVHLLFGLCWGIPAFVSVIEPGLTHFDEVLGWPPLPLNDLFLVLGILLALPGLYLGVLTNKLLWELGHGNAAFRFTKNVVAQDIYNRTRNPMSLGYYMVVLGIAFILGSTFLTIAALLAVIPAHLFFLKYFEEKELELRFGEPYLAYKKKVPFLFPRLDRVVS